MKYLLLLFSAMALFSCTYDNEEDQCDYQPYDCNEVEPTYGFVNVHCNPNSLNPEVPVTFYDGDIEDGHVINHGTVSNSTKEFFLPNGSITAIATYNAIINDTLVVVHVVNRRYLSADEEDYCEGSCYEEGYINMDLELMKLD